MKRKTIYTIFAMMLASTVVYAKDINSQNISKNNIALDKKANAICQDKYKNKYKVPGVIGRCANKIKQKWNDQGLYEGTIEYAKKNYGSLSDSKLFSLLPTLFQLRVTSRKMDNVTTSEIVEGEMYHFNYTIELNYIIRKLMKNNYKPKWGKDKLSQQLKSYWGDIRAYDVMSSGR